MRRIARTTVAMLALAALLPTAALAATPPTTLTLTSTGVIQRDPDRVVVTFGIITNDDRAQTATSKNNAIYAALLAKLTALGLRPDQVRTLAYGVSFNQRPTEPDPRFISRYGFVVNRMVNATTDVVTQAGALIDAGVAAGATSVNQVAFVLRDQQAAQRAAEAAAVTDAQEQAATLAAAAHLRVTGVVSIDAGASSPIVTPFPRFASAYQASATLAVPTDVQPSSLSVERSVTMVFRLEP
ncbi:MAG: SIMPL domain-containing protein [Vulcanimicrobiaceae bacterium]|jgi:uncharacterized protein YggE